MTTREATVNAWQDYTDAKETHEAAKADPNTHETIRKATSRLHLADLSASTIPFTLMAFTVLIGHGHLWLLAVAVFIGQVLAMTRHPAAERTLEAAHNRESDVYDKFTHFLNTVADEARDLGFHVTAVNRNQKYITTSQGTITVAVDPETHTPELFLDGRPLRHSYRANSREMTDLDGNRINASEDALVLP